MSTTINNVIAVLLTVILYCTLTNGFVVKLEARNVPTANQILLRCVEGGIVIPTTNLGLNRSVFVDGVATEYVFSDFSAVNSGEITFVITPDTEGNYTCINKDTNTRSTNSLPLVASPTVDPQFAISSTKNVPFGSNATLPCSLRIGLLSEYYSVEWYRGTSPLDTSVPQYEINSDLSLSILNATELDTSSSYYCKLTVQEPVLDVTYTQYGLDVDLKVYGDLNINTLSDIVVIEGTDSSVVFRCTINSVPAGYIRWLVNSTQVMSDNKFTVETKQIKETPSYVSVSSNLTISNPTSSDSGTIQCIGYTENGIGTLVVADQATLTVLSNDFNVTYETTASGSFSLTLSSPGIIPQVFTIHLRLTSGSNVFDLMLADPSFYNIAYIDRFEVTRSLFPLSFISFTVSAAIKVQAMMGAYSTPSDIIVLPISSVSSAPVLPTTTTPATTLSQISSSAMPTATTPTSSQLGAPASVTNTIGGLGASPSSLSCPECNECFNFGPLIVVIIIMAVLLVAMFILLIGIFMYCWITRRRSKPYPKEDAYHQVKHNNIELYVANPCSASTTPSHTSCSHDSHTHTNNSQSQSPCSCDESRAYSSADEYRSQSCTPSRPSSQESYFNLDKRHLGSKTTPSPLPHIYENDVQVKFKRKLNMSGESESHHTTSSIAVGTSPPRDGKEIIIPLSFTKGQSESPKRREDKFPGRVLSPSHSDPSLESSLKSTEYSNNKRGFSETVAIPIQKPKDTDQTYTSPTEALRNPAQPTLQQFLYGNRKPPFKAKEDEPMKEDDKIYQTIANEYDIVGDV